MQVPLRKTNLNGGVLRNVSGSGPATAGGRTGMGGGRIIVNDMSATLNYPQQHTLMTTITNNGSDGFATTATAKSGL